MPRKCKLVISNGTVKLPAIPVIGRRDAKGNLWIAEIDGYAENQIPLCGTRLKARVVLKIYCKPDSPRARMAIERLHGIKKKLKQ